MIKTAGINHINKISSPGKGIPDKKAPSTMINSLSNYVRREQFVAQRFILNCKDIKKEEFYRNY
ncbi:MAG: hypothetical protein Kow0029_05950 [Candidatus Rifleibacteriota bacterium]